MGVVAGELVDAGEEVLVGGGVAGMVPLAGLVDVAGDPVVGRDLPPDERRRPLAEGGDEGEQVAAPVALLAQRVVEQHRTGGRGHELVGLAQDLSQVLRQAHLRGEGDDRPAAFEERLHLPRVERVDADGHRASERRIIPVGGKKLPESTAGRKLQSAAAALPPPIRPSFRSRSRWAWTWRAAIP